jgi:SAM-dependent methyltransferase
VPPGDTRTTAPADETLEQLRDTQRAFDSVAAEFDGPRGNNPLVQDMRAEMWRCLDGTFRRPARLLDMGCGAGLDAIRMARLGHQVTAIDWSAEMVRKTSAGAHREGVQERVRCLPLGAHELDRLAEDATYEGIYSDLGPLNCVPDLTSVSRQCARLLAPGGTLVICVMGRICPWEIAHYARRGRWDRVRIRFARGIVSVGMNRHKVWTRYYGPRELFRAFAGEFRLVHHRGVCVFAPPPYLESVRDRYPRLYRRLWQLDRVVAGWPVLRGWGDHFLMILRKR